MVSTLRSTVGLAVDNQSLDGSSIGVSMAEEENYEQLDAHNVLIDCDKLCNDIYPCDWVQ